MNGKLRVAFLWHMHQPLYKDLLTGKYHLPWVRLHSTFSYYDMAKMMDKCPGIKCTFNLTSSLIWQLIDISNSEKIDDLYLEVSEKKPQDLEEEEKVFLLKNFFSCDYATCIRPLKGYRKLFKKRGENLSREALLERIGYFSRQEYLDLQVYFNLAWCGFTLRNENSLVKTLVNKASRFTEKEKQDLLTLQMDVVKGILPLYKRLQEEGKIEISTTPFYHPILPLLCGKDGDFTRDARVQIERAVEFYREVFGSSPQGMWPSEGSVSPEIIPLLRASDIKWIATDEGILIESFKGEDFSRDELIYKAYKAASSGEEIDIVFRDINLSNAISFRYSKLSGKEAAHDFIADLGQIKEALAGREENSLVSIILDGENPWPYYADGGKKFLSEVYGFLSKSDDFEAVTIGEYLSKNKERGVIENLYSGSWIDRNFRKWKGSPQKDKAWEYLKKTREDLFSSGQVTEEALEELYIAEGSDWFWWYDEFGTELNFIFDELFRLHLSNVYRLIGKDVPHYLDEAIARGPSPATLPELVSAGEMAKELKVLFVSSESVPFAKTGGLADVSGSLPKELNSMGCDVRVIMPLYRCITDRNFTLSMEGKSIKGPFKREIPHFDLYSAKSSGVTTYLVKNKKYFSRGWLYGTPQSDYKDNAVRFGFFCKAALSSIKEIGFKPDLIHCNDWQTALVPFLIKFMLSNDSFYRGVKTLFTIHNLAYQGLFSRKFMRKLGIPESFFNMNDLEFYGKLSFMKSGILYSDAVSTVSHRYAEEIMTPELGCGLEGLLRSRKDSLYGIPNGVDYSVWSPRKDSFLKVNYDIDSVEKKEICKKDLIEYTSLKVSPTAPVLGAVTRLAEQKGMDLFAEVVPQLASRGAGIVVLGRGSERYNMIFRNLAKKYPGKVYVCQDFNEELAHKIESGSDIFVMPSRYEPCGLNQMYSIKYGTIPVVRATGGLDDVIVDYEEDPERGNGFKFYQAEAEMLLEAIDRAIKCFNEKEEWERLVKNAMGYDFSWRNSAEKYLALYNRIVG